MKHKMYCIFARESIDKMNGSAGKLAAQAGHAYLHSYWDATTSSMFAGNEVALAISERKELQANDYINGQHAFKIALVVDTVDELKVLFDAYRNICGVSLVEDAGFTVFSEPTITCLGIGPISEENIGDDIKALPLLGAM